MAECRHISTVWAVSSLCRYERTLFVCVYDWPIVLFEYIFGGHNRQVIRTVKRTGASWES